jgi:hypothetical protein
VFVSSLTCRRKGLDKVNTLEIILEPMVEMIFLAQKRMGVVFSVYTMIIK